MEYLPPEEEREWLLERLADLCARRGYERLVTCPILEPNGTYFPDWWRPDPRGVELLLRRLFRYAGLEGVELELELVEEDGVPEEETEGCMHRSSALWFSGIEDDCCWFGVDAERLEDPEGIVGLACHAVAHAFRAHHGLDAGEALAHAYRAPQRGVAGNRALEEQLSDVTAVYLGFGLIAANESLRHKSTGWSSGYMHTLRVSQSAAGTLPPQSMCFLLAAQTIARGTDAKARKALAAELETNQAAFYRAACKALEPGPLVERLGVPASSEWPEPPSLAELTRPVEAEDAFDRESAAPPSIDTLPRPKNEGQVVFRVRRTRASTFGTLFGLLGVIGGAAMILGLPEAGALWIAPIGLLAGLGVAFGKRMRNDFCSDPSCEAPHPQSATTCPKCGGRIAGEIAKPADRLGALEELEARAARAKATKKTKKQSRG